MFNSFNVNYDGCQSQYASPVENELGTAQPQLVFFFVIFQVHHNTEAFKVAGLLFTDDLKVKVLNITFNVSFPVIKQGSCFTETGSMICMNDLTFLHV